MILHTIKRNLAQIKSRMSPSLSAKPSRKVAHHHVDRAALTARIQIAYRISPQEAEAQIEAAEKRGANTTGFQRLRVTATSTSMPK